MFSIIISEKGGAERRETYDRTEINVGRVQGNDLMLPKGNVSKRHARLLYRDGRFIVTDLKSTNGTYVNGRKIAQATIVREGDKIYIGDFVLRIEAAAGTSLPSPQPLDESSGDHQGIGESSQPSQPSSAEKALQRASLPRIESKPGDGSRQEVISHFPLEQDPDDSVPAYAVPGPPRIPSGAPRTGALKPSGPPAPILGNTTAANPAPVGRSTSPSVGVAPAAVAGGPAPAIASPVPTSSPSGVPAPGLSPSPPSPAGRRAIPPLSDRVERQHDPAQVTAHRTALVALVDRVTEMLDLSSLAAGGPAEDALANRIERALAERVTSMKADGEMSPDVDADALVVEGRRELLELGPISPMLEDEDVSEVQVFRHDFVVAMHGRRQAPAEVAFTSEHALVRAIRRLCLSSDRPLAEGETYVERRLAHGARMFAVLPPAADHGHML